MKHIWTGVAIMALVGCQPTGQNPVATEAAQPEQSSAPVLCRIEADACQDFNNRLPSFSAALTKPVSQRNVADNLTNQVLLNTLLGLDRTAQSNCQPFVGETRAIASLSAPGLGQATLVGDGAGMCALIKQ